MALTLDQIKALDRDFLLPAEAAGPLACDPQYIRAAARQNPALLGFPVIVIGNRVKIPRKPFINFLEG